MINWLRPPTNLLICVYSSNEVGLELKHFSDFDLKKQDIQGKSIRLDIERHFDQLADLLAHDSEDFMLYCNLIINENYEYNISAGDINTEKDYEKFLNQIDQLSRELMNVFYNQFLSLFHLILWILIMMIHPPDTFINT